MKILLADLKPGTSYYFKLKGKNATLESEWSKRFTLTTINYTTNPDAPLAPTWVAVGTSFHGTWSSVNTNSAGVVVPIVRYEIELTALAMTYFTSVVQATGALVTYDLSYENNRTYFNEPQSTVSIRIRSVDNLDRKSAWSPKVTASNGVPNPPTNPGVTEGTDSMDIFWTPPSDTDILHYNVYVGTVPEFVPTLSNRVFQGSDTRFTYTSIAYVLQYFKIRTVDSFLQESVDAVTSGTPVSPFVVDVVAPDAPTWTGGTIVNNLNGIGAVLNATWSQTLPSPNDLNGFEIRYRKVGDTNWNSAGSFPLDARAATIALPLAYSNYEFNLRSYDKSQNHSVWVANTFTSPANVAPNNVTGLASVANRESIRYNWNSVTDQDLRNYEVTFSTSSTFASGNITFLTGTANYLDVGGLNPGTTYYARVRAVDVAGLTSAAWTATDTKATLVYTTYTSDGVAPTASPAATVAGGIGFLHIQWPAQANNDPVTYEVHISTTTGFTPAAGTKVAETPATTIILEKDVAGAFLVYGTTYFIRIIAKDRDGSAAAGTQGSAAPLKITALDSTLTAGDVGAPTTAQFNTAIKTSVNEYSVNASETVAPTTGWSTTQPARTAGTFVWFRTIVTYQDNTTNTSSAALLTGNTGATGTSGSSIGLTATTQILGSPAGGGATTPTTSTVTGAPTNTTISTWDYSIDGAAFSVTVPAGISRTGNVVTVTGSAMTARTIAIRATGASGVVDTMTVAKTLDGAAGTSGLDAYTVLLTNEAQVFAGTVNTAVAGSTTCGVIAYKGSTQIASTINSFGVTPTGMTVAATSNGTTTTGFTVTVTTALVQQNGTFAVNLTVDGNTFTQVFSWSVAYIGSPGTGITSVTPYFQTVTPIGAAAPVLPTANPPGGAWVTTEPAYVANTELYRTERIIYSNSTYAYTAVNKVSAYTAAAEAMTTASGKNKIIRNTAAATGTAYVNGDLWFQYSGTNLTTGTILGQWLFDTGVWVQQTLRNEVIANLDVGKLTSGSISTADISLTSTGYIRSTDFLAGTTGWRLGNGVLEINNGTIKASALTTGTLASSIITLGAGGILKTSNSEVQITNTGISVTGVNSSITATALTTGTFATGQALTVNGNMLLNGNMQVQTGGYIKSTEYTGTTFATNPSALGWYLGRDGLKINSGAVSASTLTAGTLGSSTGLIQIGAGAALVLNGGYLKSNTYVGTAYSATATAGFYLGDDGLRIANGSVSAATLTTGDITSASITLSSTSEIKTAGYNGSVGFRLSASGLEIPTGSINISQISVGTNSISGNALTSISGNKITTGIIQSNNYGTSGQPYWSIDLAGSAVFAALSVLGNTVLGTGTADTTSLIGTSGYVTGAAVGWQIKANGDAIFSNAFFNGTGNSLTLNAGTMSVNGGNIKITSGFLSGAGNTGTTISTAINSNTGYYLGSDGFYVGSGTITGSTISGGTIQTDSNTAVPRIRMTSSSANTIWFHQGPSYVAGRIYSEINSYGTASGGFGSLAIMSPVVAGYAQPVVSLWTNSNGAGVEIMMNQFAIRDISQSSASWDIVTIPSSGDVTFNRGILIVPGGSSGNAGNLRVNNISDYNAGRVTIGNTSTGINAPGYIKNGSGTLTMTAANTAYNTGNISFGTAFPASGPVPTLSVQTMGVTGANNVSWSVSSVSRSGFTIYGLRSAGATAIDYAWIAIAQ